MLKRQLFLALAVLILSASAAFALDGADYVPDNLPEAITFKGITLERAYTEGRAAKFIVEYIPKGESLEHWSTLFAVRRTPLDLTPLKYAVAFAQQVTKSNPKVEANVIFKEETPEQAMVSFVAAGGGIVEYNLWKIMKMEGCNELISYQYAVRSYGKLTREFTDFLGNLQPTIDTMRDYRL